MKRKTSRNAKLLQLADAGTPRKVLANQFGISLPRVFALLYRERGMKKREKPRLPDMPDSQRRTYEKMRRYYGAAYARREMGIDA